MRNYQNLPRPIPTLWKRLKCFCTRGHVTSWSRAAVGGKNIQYCMKCGVQLAEHPVGTNEAKVDRYGNGVFRRR